LTGNFTFFFIFSEKLNVFCVAFKAFTYHMKKLLLFVSILSFTTSLNADAQINQTVNNGSAKKILFLDAA